jgi:hypothetical protein
MNISIGERINRMLLVFISTLILIAGSFLSIYALNLKKRDLDTSQDSSTSISLKN